MKKSIDTARAIIATYTEKYKSILNRNPAYAHYTALATELATNEDKTRTLTAKRDEALSTGNAKQAVEIDKELATTAAEIKLLSDIIKGIDPRTVLPQADKERLGKEFMRALSDKASGDLTAQLEKSLSNAAEYASALSEIFHAVQAFEYALQDLQQQPLIISYPSASRYEKIKVLTEKAAAILNPENCY